MGHVCHRRRGHGSRFALCRARGSGSSIVNFLNSPRVGGRLSFVDETDARGRRVERQIIARVVVVSVCGRCPGVPRDLRHGRRVRGEARAPGPLGCPSLRATRDSVDEQQDGYDREEAVSGGSVMNLNNVE